jgi:hypothetical protein
MAVWQMRSRLAHNDALPPVLTHTAYFAVFLLLYTFLATPASQAVWENVPLLELAEFPWRMLGPAIFCAAVLSAAGFYVLLRLTQRRRQGLLLLLTLFGVIVLNRHYLYPSQFIEWGSPTPADAFAYEVTSGAIGTTSTGEFLPRWAEQHPQPQTLWPDYEAGEWPRVLDPANLPPAARARTVSYRSEALAIEIDTPEAFQATLRALYWPGWQLYLNDQPVPFEITPGSGLFRTEIPSGQHRLTLQLESTPLRTTGLALSVTAVLLLAGITVRRAWLHRRQLARASGGQRDYHQATRSSWPGLWRRFTCCRARWNQCLYCAPTRSGPCLPTDFFRLTLKTSSNWWARTCRERSSTLPRRR